MMLFALVFIVMSITMLAIMAWAEIARVDASTVIAVGVTLTFASLGLPLAWFGWCTLFLAL